LKIFISKFKNHILSHFLILKKGTEHFPQTLIFRSPLPDILWYFKIWTCYNSQSLKCQQVARILRNVRIRYTKLLKKVLTLVGAYP